MVPLAVVTVVAAAACVPVAWPLLAGGAVASQTALAAAFAQVGGVGGGVVAEAVIRVWDRLRLPERRDVPQRELREALAAELGEALGSASPSAARLRAEIAGVLRGVDAVQVALTATIESAVTASGDQVRAVLVHGFQDVGTRFSEFGWLLQETRDQITGIAEAQAELAASSRAILEAQQQTLMQLTILRQQASAARASGGIPDGEPELLSPEDDGALAAEQDVAAMPAGAECPYPGLAAFGPQNASWFFGREEETAALVARLAGQLTRPGLLMVLGPSGSGKSSLLRAGLLPAIAGGMLPVRGTQWWPLDLMTPGRRPLLELSTRVAAMAGIPAGALDADLRADPARIAAAIRQGLLVHVRRLAEPSNPARRVPVIPGLGNAQQAGDEVPDLGEAGPRLLLIVDQFEEVFTQCPDEEERRAFIHALLAAAGLPRPAEPRPPAAVAGPREAPTLIVLGIRADFYARTAAYPELAPFLQDSQFLVGPMGETGLRAAIREPARAAGLTIDADLVEVLLADLGQHTRTVISRGPATVPDNGLPVWSAVGGQAAASVGSYEAGRLALLSYALQQTWRNREGRRLTMAGYRATGGIDGAVARAADSVHNRLDAAGQAALQRVLLRLVTIGEDIPNTRRRVAVAELTDSEDSNRAILTSTVLADLIGARLVTADGEAVEITHETLLTAWPRLQQWLAEDREALLIRRDLTDATRDWKQEGRDPSHLFRGTRLAVARDWAANHAGDLNADERAFLGASQHEQLRTIRLRRTAVAGLAVLTVVSIIAAIVAGIQRSDAVSQSHAAQSESHAAQSEEMAAEATNLFSANAPLAMLLSLQAYERAPTLQAKSALIQAAGQPLADVLTEGSSAVHSVAFSPNGQILAAGDLGGDIGLWNAASGRRTATLPEGSPIDSVAFSPNAQMLAAGDYTKNISLWDIANARRTATLPEGSLVLSVAFSPNGQMLAAGDLGGDIGLWDMADGRRIATLAEGSAVASVAFSPNGQMLAAGELDGDIGLWDMADGRRIATLAEGSAVASVAFSPNAQMLAAGDYAGDIGQWDIANDRRTGTLAEGSPVYSVTFSPNGQTLAAGDLGGRIGLWDTGTGQRTGSLAEGSPVYSAAFSPNGQTLAAGDYGGDIGLWNTGTGQRAGSLAEGSPVYSAAFSPNGQTLAVGGSGGDIGLWDTGTGRRAAALAEGSPIVSVAFSPDGQILAAGDAAGYIGLWDIANDRRTARLSTGSSPVYSVAFSPNGQTLAAAGSAGKIGLWNMADGQQTATLPQNEPVDSVAFSPDGRVLAAGDLAGYIGLWDIGSGRRTATLSEGSPVDSVAFSPNGQVLAAGDVGGHIGLWRTGTGQRTGTLAEGSLVHSVTFSPNGQILAAGDSGDDISLWDTRSGRRTVTLAEGSPVYSVVFSTNGQTLAIGDLNGNVTLFRQGLWNLPESFLSRLICGEVRKNMTQAQWAANAPGQPYQKTCPAHS
jgi:WD40 repeat protein